MSKHVLVIGGGMGYYHPFRQFGRFSRDQAPLNQPDEIALVVFTGGADISPSLYGHKPSRLTMCTVRRDIHEMCAYRRARKHNLPIAGVCRGAQFLCAMAGGSLYQHVEGHGYCGHYVRTWDDRVVYVTSTHHQMQNPPDDAVVLAWAEPRRSTLYIGESDKKMPNPHKEYECVYYPSINALGMQYHPEMMSDHSPGFRLAGEMVEKWLLKRETIEQPLAS